MAFRFGFRDPATITLVRTVLETLSEKANVRKSSGKNIFARKRGVKKYPLPGSYPGYGYP